MIAHLYAAHFREVVLLGLHAHLNLTFAHLTALHNRFSLIETKETEVLRDLEQALRLSEDTTQQSDLINVGKSNSDNISKDSSMGTSSDPDSSNQQTSVTTDCLDPNSEVTRA